MNVVEQTESRMVVRRSPFRTLLFGCLFMIAGVFWLTQSSGKLGTLFFSLACIAVGRLLVLSVKRVTVVADKLRATVSITSRSLLHGDKRSVAIADVECITTEERVKLQRSLRSQKVVNNFVLVFRDGSPSCSTQKS